MSLNREALRGKHRKGSLSMVMELLLIGDLQDTSRRGNLDEISFSTSCHASDVSSYDIGHSNWAIINKINRLKMLASKTERGITLTVLLHDRR